jgi:hypothetical protein
MTTTIAATAMKVRLVGFAFLRSDALLFRRLLLMWWGHRGKTLNGLKFYTPTRFH